MAIKLLLIIISTCIMIGVILMEAAMWSSNSPLFVFLRIILITSGSAQIWLLMYGLGSVQESRLLQLITAIMSFMIMMTITYAVYEFIKNIYK